MLLNMRPAAGQNEHDGKGDPLLVVQLPEGAAEADRKNACLHRQQCGEHRQSPPGQNRADTGLPHWQICRWHYETATGVQTPDTPLMTLPER